MKLTRRAQNQAGIPYGGYGGMRPSNIRQQHQQEDRVHRSVNSLHNPIF
jgi:hypothetical protein